MLSRVLWLAGTSLVVVLLAAPPSSADALKASRKCRAAIAQLAGRLLRTGLALVDACHAARDQGKRAGPRFIHLVEDAD